ncbi:acyloxyacyl hydrolase [Aquimarina rubra]|uniref:Acyloxyacyl hydrolase n=1 Tax=Aquimarina rubra TaxID=1920033 RepID=A0ABW5LHJ0_9FLAO
MIKRICLLLVLLGYVMQSQEDKKYYSFDINNFYGTILKHNPDISHLITGHPSGVIISANRKTFGTKEWQRLYNSPDYGVSFIYQNMDNEFLGENYGLYAHYNFYFFKRILMLRLGQGLAYTTNPYDQDENFRNVAYGSHFMSSTFAMLNLKRENLIGGLGIQTGIGVIHYSNANFKAPNKSTNTFVFNVGLNYILDTEYPEYVEKEKGAVKGAESIGYGFIFRGGINESDVVGSGQYPFYTIGAFADKRLNKKSSIQLGAELFFSEALERFIDFRSTGNFRGDDTTGDEDSKRVGVFLGHELRINKISILTQLGYYIYYPYDFEGQVYNRFGARYYFNKNIFGSITVRSHAAKAEAVEFSIGYRL